MNKLDFNDFIYLVDQEINSQIASTREYENLHHPISYHFQMRGSRMIPKIAYIFYKILNINIDIAVIISSSIELFHNFTIVHDDIIDRDKIRRGQQSLWDKYSKNKAIVIGDSIFILSINELSKLIHIESLRSRFHEVIQKFTEYTLTICEGECLDIEFEKKLGITFNECLNMEIKKSGSTIGILLHLLAFNSHSYKKESLSLEVVEKIGINIGLSLQILNDINNIKDHESEQTDIHNFKNSTPITLALQHLEKYHSSINDITNRMIIETINQNKIIEKLFGISKDYMNMAYKSVESLNLSDEDSNFFLESVYSFFGVKLINK